MDENDITTFMDKWGACKICDGEIPDGHQEKCYLYEQEKKINDLEGVHAEDNRGIANQNKQISDLEAKVTRLTNEVMEWSEDIPTEQACYWHWNGDQDSAPMIYYIMWSPRGCFISQGQLGITQAIDCKDYGGHWRQIKDESPPTDKE